MQEIFKDIKNYIGLYQVSNLGNVKALDRYNTDKNGKTKFYPGKLLNFDVNKNNVTAYHRVTLSKNGKTKRFMVHRLVAEAFISNPSTKPYVNHIDNNGTNNSVSNLEWCTHSENMQHSQQQGRQFTNQSKAGKKAGSLLREEAIKQITDSLGTTINNYKILEYVGFSKERHRVKAQCQRCDSITELAYRHITRGKNANCSKCRNVKEENLQSWKEKLRNKI